MIERLEKETDKSWQAFQDYFAMGQGRSVRGLHTQYMAKRSKKIIPPTKSYKTLLLWSSRYGWDGRVKAADKAAEEERLQRMKEEQDREYMERLRSFRKVADQSVTFSMVTSASTLKSVQAIAEKVVERIQLETQTNLKDLMTVAQVLDLLTRNTNQGFDLKAKIEGLDAVLQQLEE